MSQQIKYPFAYKMQAVNLYEQNGSKAEVASQCGCLTKSVIVDFIQGHLKRSRGHFFCIDRRKLFDFDLLL